MNLKSISDAIKDTIEHQESVKSGISPSIRLQYENINNATMNGLPKNRIHTIAGHSGVGKTTLLNNIISQAPILNDNLRVLFFTMEMPAYGLIQRMVSSIEKTTVKNLNLDSNYTIKDETLNSIASLPIDFVESSGTLQNLEVIIENYITSHLQIDPKTEFLICIDHTLLLSGDSDQELLNKLPKVLNELKKKYKSSTYLILSQLNDAMLDPQRINNISMQYPTYRDMYLGRQLYQISDTVIILNKPASYLTGKDYGPKYITRIKGASNTVYDIIYGHIIKGRDTGTEVIAFVDQLQFNTLKELDINNCLR